MVGPPSSVVWTKDACATLFVHVVCNLRTPQLRQLLPEFGTVGTGPAPNIPIERLRLSDLPQLGRAGHYGPPTTLKKLKTNMPNRSMEVDGGIANLELSLIDLRAHFEAQLRTVKRAERCLLQCRGARDVVAFKGAAGRFRDQLAVVAENRKTIATLLDQIAGEAGKLRFARRAPRADAPHDRSDS